MSFLKKFDSFAQPITLNLKGEYSQATKLGGACSLLMYSVLLYFTVMITKRLVNFEEPVTSQFDTFYPLDDDEFKFDGDQVNFGFGV
jgi:hypothetical protein